MPDGTESPARVVMLEERTSHWMVPQNATADSQDFWTAIPREDFELVAFRYVTLGRRYDRGVHL